MAEDAGRHGLLIVNLGTPDAPTAPAVRRYLREFLSDRRVVDLARWIWLPILYLFVLTFRPRRVARNYQKIWSPQGSPLLVGTRALAEAVRAQAPRRPVAVGMRYGRPSIADGLAELEAAGAETVTVVPLYPQFSHTTTTSVDDALHAARARVPGIRRILRVADWHDDRQWAGLLAGQLHRWRAEHGAGERLLISFHGIPQRYADAGDPYPRQCERSAALLAEAAGLAPGDWELVYQSRFGKAPWLRPYADERVRELAAEGLRRIDVICPGFVVDCLETLEEIAIGLDETFREAGGERLRLIPALPADEAVGRALVEIAARRAEPLA